MKTKAFTLAEVLIVLVLIGVLTAILLPVAFHAAPDEDVMKFKKGYNTLATVIRELVTSDIYYQNGDLGKRSDGNLIDGEHNGDYEYFCNSFAQIVSTKQLICSSNNTGGGEYYGISHTKAYGSNCSENAIANEQIKQKQEIDTYCSEVAPKTNQRIITTDNITYFEGNPYYTYGMPWKKSLQNAATNGETCEQAFVSRGGSYDDAVLDCADESRLFSDPSGKPKHTDCSGFDRVYKLFCMDIDNINDGEAPFGFGIRADGKIVTGAKADEWLEKSFQKR